ncbi:unnamed protein product, partial [Prorocentrum cordatum]
SGEGGGTRPASGCDPRARAMGAECSASNCGCDAGSPHGAVSVKSLSSKAPVPYGPAGSPVAGLDGCALDMGDGVTASYEGSWRQEQKHGEGRLVFSDGSKYEGQFRSDRKHGRGKYTYANGSSYEGQWSLDVQEGEGVERLADGSLYEGCFLAGDKSGRGRFSWGTGHSYEARASPPRSWPRPPPAAPRGAPGVGSRRWARATGGAGNGRALSRAGRGSRAGARSARGAPSPNFRGYGRAAAGAELLGRSCGSAR